MSTSAQAVQRPAAPAAAPASGVATGSRLLRLVLVAVLGPPIAAVAGFGALLALVMAGSILAVGAVVFAYAAVALLAIGAAG